MLKSQICQEKDFATIWFFRACQMLKNPPAFHRKLWEYAFIYEALLERGMLQLGKHGIGFGVGQEPLVSMFAAHGSQILATDLDLDEAIRRGWVDTNQHSHDLTSLNRWNICDDTVFRHLVSFQSVDMNAIPNTLNNKFDFSWSSSSLEHLGSLKNSKQFLLKQMETLRPGGVAVHTTEYNLFSNDATYDNIATVVFRKRDIEDLVEEFHAKGYEIEVDFTIGEGPIESIVDMPPFEGPIQLRIQLGEFVTTSIGLIIQKK
ncbi:methyltransferase domain-containing protein [Risungbinella massiliensis]|uniref:methyltransferase domain-containing protein n=1 Tax=Risungbinella massiliensis TaxID=1329796 RepID=UPI0005CBD109|nr:methyltransferase domain-containing protein [Risungbinella massiliensis]